MKPETLQTVAYLRGELSRDEQKTWEAEIDADPKLRQDVSETRQIIKLVKDWQPPESDDTVNAGIMARVRNAPRPVKKTRFKLSDLIVFIKTLGFGKPLTAGLVMASLIAGLIFVLNQPGQFTGHENGSVGLKIKKQPVFTQGPRLPKPTLLLDVKTLDSERIKDVLENNGVRVARIHQYKHAAVLEVKVPDSVNLSDVLDTQGQIIRYNEGYLNPQGLAVVVVRRSFNN